MSLALVFGLLTLALFGLFWGGSLFAQGYFYQNPAERLPLRAAVAALLVGLFISFWVWLDQKHPAKYDTFFEFRGETTSEFTEFDAVRWQLDPTTKTFKKSADGKLAETTTTFKRVAGGKTPTFVDDATKKKFAANDTESMTAAIIVKIDDAPARFSAVTEDDGKGGKSYPRNADARRFVDDQRRYVKETQIGVVYVPASGVVVLSLLLNFLLFVVWFVAFWPVLKFTWGHALGFAAVLGLVTMLLVLPMLFKPNREGNKAPEAAGGRASTLSINA